MSVNTPYDMKVVTVSKRNGKHFTFTYFREFSVSIDIREDVDSFDIIIPNPNGIYSGYVHRFDDIHIYINDKKVMVGTVDTVTYQRDRSTDEIRIEGRDKMAFLVDYERSPVNKKIVDVKKYFKERAKNHGIACKVTKSKVPKYKKLKVGVGQDELSIMEDLISETDFKYWYLVDTLYLGKWNTGGKAKYCFTGRGYSEGIPISELTFKEDGSKLLSGVFVYATTKNGGYKLKKKVLNSYMKKHGVRKVKRHRAYENTASSQYRSVGARKIKDHMFDSTELTISVMPNTKSVFMPNTVALIKDKELGINTTMLIVKVEYSCDRENGSSVELSLVPSNASYNLIWSGKEVIPVK